MTQHVIVIHPTDPTFRYEHDVDKISVDPGYGLNLIIGNKRLRYSVDWLWIYESAD